MLFKTGNPKRIFKIFPEKKTQCPITIIIYRKGLGVRDEIRAQLQRDYFSGVVTYLKTHGHQISAEGLTIFLAREFGFCYGVERAVDYAYQARQKFPDRRIFLIGDMIHNPFVNRQLQEMGIQILPIPKTENEDYSFIKEKDVVVLPAFGVPVHTLALLKKRGCILVDTTCGSVISVWKRVESYVRDGFTVLVHGKYDHEETRATVSHAKNYLVVLNEQEVELVCRFIRTGAGRDTLLRQFQKAVSPHFDPDRDLQKIGLANQTTMLRGESLKIAEKIRRALIDRYGEESLPEHFRNFDTVCSATQDRQDAVVELLSDKNIDLMVVVGGYNSSNTGHLAEIAAQKVPTFHIESAEEILDSERIRCRDPISGTLKTVQKWLPSGPVNIGLTAGASTPNNILGEVIERLFSVRGISLKERVAQTSKE
ncbi:MAG: 4-hydroxy-3-methylbut-2-enyl diphosphate reductase [Calditrichaeota bacterium]|nr:4-hydroxy-3-methylbut-2-enyl diphosphate reductase [Calditrichota bacterium]